MSKFEDKVAKIFNDAHICYKREVSFPDLKGLRGKPLRFDFVLFDDRGKIICCTEIDGPQHFKQIKAFQKTALDFRYAQECDRIKNAYCLKKKIPLIRIPYWEENNLTIERILTDQSFFVVNKFHNDFLRKKVK